MERKDIKASDFAAFVENRFENFVERLEIGASIMMDPNDASIRRILRGKGVLYGWHVRPTPISYEGPNHYGLHYFMRDSKGGRIEYPERQPGCEWAGDRVIRGGARLSSRQFEGRLGGTALVRLAAAAD
jgi:hypothetical protein